MESLNPNGCEQLDFVNDVDLKAEGLILSGRVMLQKSMFLEVYYT